jgi:uroporphyrinogen decarboxylase
MIDRKENFLRAVLHEQPEWIPYWGEGSFEYVLPSFNEMPEKGGYDDWGCKWEYSPATGPYPSRERRISSLDALKGFRTPDPDAPGLLDAAKQSLAAIDRTRTVVACNNHIGMHERAYILMGMEEYLLQFSLDEQLITDLFDKILDFKLRLTRRMLRELDVDAIWFGDDWGTQTSLFVSPDRWRAVFKPRLKKLYETVHEKGKLVFQHSCGRIESIIPDLVEVGVDVWNPCQPTNDLQQLKQAFGASLTFMGAVDSVILDTRGAQDIENEIRLRINQLKQGGGLVLYPSHHVQFPEENVRLFRECAIRYGRYK